jgi:hypothetical protein
VGIGHILIVDDEEEERHRYTHVLRRADLWFKIPADNNGDCVEGDSKDKGTFSIGADETIVGNIGLDDLDIRVYQARDLSWQLPPAHLDTVSSREKTLNVYNLQDPPYYVRVSAPNVQETSFPFGFEMTFRKNTCTEPHTDYCLLTPGSTNAVTVGWPGSDKYVCAWDFSAGPCDETGISAAACTAPGPVNDHQSPFHFDYMYFRFFVDAAGSGANPNIDFTISTTDETGFNLLNTSPGKGIRIFDAGDGQPGSFNVKLCDPGDPHPGCSAAASSPTTRRPTPTRSRSSPRVPTTASPRRPIGTETERPRRHRKKRSRPSRGLRRELFAISCSAVSPASG